eukprot:4497899-Prymnesium_polylepis.3
MLRGSLKGTCVTRVLACINPGTMQFQETRNVLLYVERATRVVIEEVKKEEKAEGDGEEGDGDGDGEGVGGGEGDGGGEVKDDDPMENDVFDSDEAQNRRCEAVETVSFGSLFTRCSGDPADPLILYIHGATGARGKDSKMWNGLVTSFAGEMAKAEDEKQQQAKEVAA